MPCPNKKKKKAWLFAMIWLVRFVSVHLRMMGWFVGSGTVIIIPILASVCQVPKSFLNSMLATISNMAIVQTQFESMLTFTYSAFMGSKRVYVPNYRRHITFQYLKINEQTNIWNVYTVNISESGLVLSAEKLWWYLHFYGLFLWARL